MLTCYSLTYKCITMCLGLCVHPYPLLLSPMSCKVIYWDFYTLALFEFMQGVCQQIKVKCIRVVKVIVVTGSQSLLFWGQDLRINNVGITLQQTCHNNDALTKHNKNDMLSKILSVLLSFWLFDYTCINICISRIKKRTDKSILHKKTL